ncbi:GAF domain-containing protein [Thalassospira alkalitolerans]|uniref:GAF domain-containing protein n=1 Tax=Thalassospira alkalitolerans TaxID=1293890 RepID=UPI003AA8A890
MTDIAFGRLAAAYASSAQPQSSYDFVAELLTDRFGPRLMTFFAWSQGNDLCERVWSNNPEKYPVSIGKKMGPTDWGKTVLHEKTPWFGEDETAMRGAFPDYELIKSVGCASCLSAPVVASGQSIGAISILHEEGVYKSSDLDDLTALSALLVVPLLLRRPGS